MNPLGMKVIGCALLIMVFASAFWLPFASSMTIYVSGFAVILAIDWLIRRIHRAYCARFIRSKCGELIWFGQLSSFVTPCPSPYRWWIFYRNYHAVVSINDGEWQCVFEIAGPVLALASPSILCEWEEDGKYIAISSDD